MHISVHEQVVWVFCLFSLFSLYFNFISYLIAKSLLFYSRSCILKKPHVWYINLIVLLLLPTFKNWNLFLMHRINISDYAHCPSYDHVFSFCFFLEKKLLIWEENMLPNKLILISGQKGGVMTKAASLLYNLVEVMSDCDMMLWYKHFIAICVASEHMSTTILGEYCWEFKFTFFFCNFICGEQWAGFATFLSQVEF